LLEELGKYFDWQEDHSTVTGYAVDRMQYHRKLAEEFFSL